jgi:hypothetical protein
MNSNSKPAEIWSVNKKELEFLYHEELRIDEEIMELEKVDRDKEHFTKTTYRIFDLKKELYEVRDRIKQLKKQNPETEKLLINYTTFREIIERFNLKAVERIIEGEALNLGNRLGYIRINKIKVNPKKKRINWKESLDLKAKYEDVGITPRSKENPDGKNWLIPYEEDYFLRYGWVKKNGACMVKNQTVYEFSPVDGNQFKKGPKQLLAEANRENPFLHERYFYMERTWNTRQHQSSKS